MPISIEEGLEIVTPLIKERVKRANPGCHAIIKVVYNCDNFYSYWFDIVDNSTNKVLIFPGDNNTINIDKISGEIRESGLFLPGEPFWEEIENGVRIVLDANNQEKCIMGVC